MYLFLTEASNILDITVTSGEVSEIFMVSSNTFKQIQADQNGIIRQIKELGQQGKEYYEHFVNFVCGKASKELNVLADSLSEASPCGIIAIVMDSNSHAWLIGWNETDKGTRPLFLNTDNFTSGKDLTEVEGGKRTFDLKTTNAFLDIPLDSTLNDYIKSEILAGGGSAIELEFTPQYGPVLNVSNCVNDSYDTFANGTPTGFDAIYSTAGTQWAGSADEIVVVSGTQYRVEFDMVLNSGAAPDYNFVNTFGGAPVTSDAFQTATPGSNAFNFTCNSSNTSPLAFRNIAATNFEITNLSVREVL